MALTEAEQAQLNEWLAEAERRTKGKFNIYFPDTGPLRRELYVKHCQFMAAGAVHNERLMLKANRVGGTECASWELTAHLTGRYPHWWEGRRFDKPVRAWAAGDTMLTTRDIVQVSLLGPIQGVALRQWDGMVPPHLVVDSSRKSGGVPDCIDQFWVKHVTGGLSSCELKSYDQGRRAFQGTECEVVWTDEEPPQDVYTECLIRTMTVNGIIMSTFTPLMGMTPFVKDYIESAVMLDSHGDSVPAKTLMFGEQA